MEFAHYILEYVFDYVELDSTTAAKTTVKLQKIKGFIDENF